MKAGFTTSLHVWVLPPDELIKRFNSRRVQRFELLAPLVYVSQKFSITITVPKGFVSDSASVPRYLRSFVDNDDPGIFQPSILHDYICLAEGEIPEGPFDRKEADEMMLEAMEVCGMPTTQRFLVYRAIRNGGKWSKRNN